MRHEVIDGFDVFTFRQSWIATAQGCLEQARLEMRGELERVETDATAIGTAVHTAIEAVLQKQTEYHDAVMLALLTFRELSELPHYRMKQCKDFNQCTQYVVNCFTSWYEHVFPQLGESLSVERHFNVLLDEQPERRSSVTDNVPARQLRLSGTWDLDDSVFGLVDWKNKGQEIKRWEMDRWGIQPTVYTYAKRVLDGVSFDEPMDFTFVNMIKGPVREPQIITVQRHQGHYDWLRAMLWRIVDLYWSTDCGEQGWPMNDASWRCSSKWCTEFAAGRCKGAFLNI